MHVSQEPCEKGRSELEKGRERPRAENKLGCEPLQLTPGVRIRQGAQLGRKWSQEGEPALLFA